MNKGSIFTSNGGPVTCLIDIKNRLFPTQINNFSSVLNMNVAGETKQKHRYCQFKDTDMLFDIPLRREY